MRGSPLLRALLAFLVILALGYPLRKVTGGSAPTNPVTGPVNRPAEQEIVLQVTFTTAPTNFTVKHLGKVLWTSDEAATSAERKLQLPYPAEGVELQFAATFPAGSPLTAARLVLTDPAGDPHEKSLWGEGTIDGVVTFP